MGPITLQCAPESEEDDGQAYVNSLKQDGLHSINPMNVDDFRRATADEARLRQQEEIEERAAAARESAKTKGLDLPPAVEIALEERDESPQSSGESPKSVESEVGKGMFDGW
eukprot:scaffold21305_cov23-Cyclotella_meneghiniana.AAC.1